MIARACAYVIKERIFHIYIFNYRVRFPLYYLARMIAFFLSLEEDNLQVNPDQVPDVIQFLHQRTTMRCRGIEGSLVRGEQRSRDFR